MSRADDGEPELRLRIPDRVAAGERSARLANLGRSAVEDRRHRLPRQLLGEGRDREGKQDSAAHRKDIAQRVCRGDLAVHSRIVDERGKEVERPDDRQIGGHEVCRGIVGRGEADDELRGCTLGPQVGQGVGEQVGPELGRAAPAIRELGQAERGCLCHGTLGPAGLGRFGPCWLGVLRHGLPGHGPMIRGRRAAGTRRPTGAGHARATIRCGSGGVPVGPPVFKTGGATLDVTRWVRLPCAPAKSSASGRPVSDDRSSEPLYGLRVGHRLRICPRVSI